MNLGWLLNDAVRFAWISCWPLILHSISPSFSQRWQVKYLWLIVEKCVAARWCNSIPLQCLGCCTVEKWVQTLFTKLFLMCCDEKNPSFWATTLQHDYSHLIITCWVHRCRGTQNIPPKRENNNKHANATLFISTTAASLKHHISLSNQYKCREMKIMA